MTQVYFSTVYKNGCRPSAKRERAERIPLLLAGDRL